MIRFKEIFVSIFIFLCIPVISQSNKCVSVIYDYIKEMDEFSRRKDRLVHINFSMNIHNNSNKNNFINNKRYDIYSSYLKFQMKSSDVDVFGSGKDLFIVLHAIKTIYWNDFSPEILMKMNANKKFNDLQKHILKTAKNVSCKSVDNNKVINIVPSNELGKKMKLINQSIVFNPVNKKVLKVVNYFDKTNPIKRQEVIYHTINYNSNKILVDAFNNIFIKKTKLKAKYKNYKLINNTKR